MIRYDVLTSEFELDDGARFSEEAYDVVRASLSPEIQAEYADAIKRAGDELVELLKAGQLTVSE